MEKLFFKRYKKSAITIFNKLLETHGLPDLVMNHSSLWAGGALGEILNKNDIPFVITEHLKEFLIPNDPPKLTSTTNDGFLAYSFFLTLSTLPTLIYILL